MNIAMISEHASPIALLGGVDAGGQNVYVAQTAERLATRGHHVDVYTRRSDPGQAETILWRHGVRVVHVDAGPAAPVPKEEMAPFMTRFAEEVAARMAREGRPDIVHAHFWMSGLVAVALKQRLGVPFVVTFHALGKVRRMHQGDADRFPEGRFDAEHLIIDAADRIISECPQDSTDLIELYEARVESLTEIPCGFDPTELEPVDRGLARELLGIDRDAKVVLQLGRMVPRKGVDDAVRGFARATRDMQGDSLLLVVGGDVTGSRVIETPEGARLGSVAEDEGVSDRVRFTGALSREALKYFYSAADVFVSVPWYEPFGITPLEAMACGVPVLGSRVGGIKHTVADGVTGMLVEPHDADEVASALRRLLLDDVLRARMGRAARRRVNQHFTWDLVADRLEDVYREVSAPATTLADKPQTASLSQTASTLVQLARGVETATEAAGQLVAQTVLGGGTALVCGNGGSAADAQHLAAELVGRFQMERAALPALALTTDPSVITAVGNDYGFADVFARQVSALGSRADVLIAISTSGDSPNILEALRAARDRGMRTVGLLGRTGGAARRLCDVAVVVPSAVAARVQEVHQLVVHRLAEAVDEAYIGAVARPSVAATRTTQEYLA